MSSSAPSNAGSSGPNGLGRRIGKSLVKFFKPVRVAPPHSEEKKQSPSKQGFQLFQFKKGTSEKVAPSQDLSAAKDPSLHQEVATQAIAEKPPSHWLELVLNLLSACKKASHNMRQRMGLQTYKNAAAGRGRHKLKTVGSIIDTTTTILDTEEEENAA